MHPLLARLSRARLAVLVAACVALPLAPARVLATHWIVDQSGGGDFTTIQAALDAWENGLGWRESVLVMPGTYAETMTIPGWTPWAVIGVGGPGITEVSSVVSTCSGALELIQGLAFAQHVRLNYGCHTLFKNCTFNSTVSGEGWSLDLEDCDFYGRTVLHAIENPGGIPFRSLRFHGAPLSVGLINGDIGMTNCVFEGPADTLLFVEGSDSDEPFSLIACAFRNATLGLVSSSPFGIGARSCTFSNLSEAAVWLDAEVSLGGWSPRGGVGIGSSRFEDCGTAVHWTPTLVGEQYLFDPYLSLERDTILACEGDAVVIRSVPRLYIIDCIVDGSGGTGAFVHMTLPVSANDPNTQSLIVSNSHFTNNHGAGVVIEGTSGLFAGERIVNASSFARNGGPGLQLDCTDWCVAGCVSFANGGDGFAINTPVPTWPGRLVSNTSVLNQRDGFRLTGPAHPGDSLHLVQHNLAALNAGAGFRVPHQSFGSFAFNDAWSNYLGQYVGAWDSADSNLTVDPRFCELEAGDLSLQQGSPVGAGGTYGLIGALPEQCPNTTAVEISRSRLSFTVHPTVARGSVEFVPPSLGPDRRVELFDLTGRRLWGAAFGPTTGTLLWQGQSESGHARPGLYWVRFTRAGESESHRLVWLK